MTLPARVFRIDISVCARCSGPARVTRFVTTPDDIAAEPHRARPPPRPPAAGQILPFSGIESRWQHRSRSVTLDGPLEPGACFHEPRVTLGLTFDWGFRITRLSHRAPSPSRASTAPCPIAAPVVVRGGTRVVESGQLELPTGQRWLEPALARWSRPPLRQAYGRLRVLMETG